MQKKKKVEQYNIAVEQFNANTMKKKKEEADAENTYLTKIYKKIHGLNDEATEFVPALEKMKVEQYGLNVQANEFVPVQLANNDINTKSNEQEINTPKEDEVALEEVTKKKAKSISKEEYAKLLEKFKMSDSDVEDLNLNQEETEINIIKNISINEKDDEFNLKYDMNKWFENDHITDSNNDDSYNEIEDDSAISINQSDVNDNEPLLKNKLLDAFSSLSIHKTGDLETKFD